MNQPTRSLTWLVSLLAVSAHAATIEPQGRDSQAITAAVAKAVAGDTVQLPKGLCTLTETLRLKSGIKLLGSGQENTTLVYAGAKPATLVDLSGCEDVELAALAIDGRNNPLVSQGISGGRAKRLWLHHLAIRNLKAKTWGPHAILFSGRNPSMEGGVTDSRITDCLIENIGLDAEYGGGIRLA
jgi:hypothetical protein